LKLVLNGRCADQLQVSLKFVGGVCNQGLSVVDAGVGSVITLLPQRVFFL